MKLTVHFMFPMLRTQLEASCATREEAQANLGGLIHQLAPGDELIVTEGDQPIARIVVPKPRVKLGAMRGSVVYMAPDFDAPLDDFKEYQGGPALISG